MQWSFSLLPPPPHYSSSVSLHITLRRVFRVLIPPHRARDGAHRGSFRLQSHGIPQLWRHFSLLQENSGAALAGLCGRIDGLGLFIVSIDRS